MAAKKTTVKKATVAKAPVAKAPVAKAPATKPAVKKEAAPKAAPKKAPAKKAPVAKKSTQNYTAEQIYSMIEQAAYFAAENDGFKKEPASYWAKAESSVKAMLKS